mmetsp:Transcript_49681/g.115981  ORF Transcript_49681/g.115981 Transcript_49681/m.115981 type:complete len:243 (+) Transcript_49681:1242-1970(+)
MPPPPGLKDMPPPGRSEMPPPDSRPPPFGAVPFTGGALASFDSSCGPSFSCAGSSLESGSDSFFETSGSSFKDSFASSSGCPRVASIACATLLFFVTGSASFAGVRTASRTFSPASPPMRSSWQRSTKLFVTRSLDSNDRICSAVMSGVLVQSNVKSSSWPRIWRTPHCTSSLARTPFSTSCATKARQRRRRGGGQSNEALRARFTNSWRHGEPWSLRTLEALSTPGKGGPSSLTSSMTRLN